MHFLHMNAFYYACRFFFLKKDLVDIHGGIVILEFRLYKAIIQ